MKSKVFNYPFFPPLKAQQLEEGTIVAIYDEETEGYVDPNQVLSAHISIRAMSQGVADEAMELILHGD